VSPSARLWVLAAAGEARYRAVFDLSELIRVELRRVWDVLVRRGSHSQARVTEGRARALSGQLCGSEQGDQRQPIRRGKRSGA